LHLLVNPGGGIIKASFSSGNKDDRAQLKLMIKGLFGKVFGDRGYISQELFRELLEHGIFMVTRVKKNMKNGSSAYLILTGETWSMYQV